MLRYDEFDSSGLDPVAKQKALDLFQSKMSKTREQIKEEQSSRDENVDEYLRLSSNADRAQLSRIKQVFEKKNQKSAQNIAQLQKKLENYQRKVRDIEQGSLPHSKQSKEVLKAVGAGIKGGVVGTWNKPKEFAHLIRNKFGSADNIPTNLSTASSGGEGREGAGAGAGAGPTHKRTQSGHISGGWAGQSRTPGGSHQGSASLPRNVVGGADSAASQSRQTSSESSVTSESGAGGGGRGEVPGQYSEEGTVPAMAGGVAEQPWLASLMEEIHERREECDKLTRELELQRQHFKQELVSLVHNIFAVRKDLCD